MLLKKNGVKLLDMLTYRTKDTDFSAQITKAKALNPGGIALGALASGESLIRNPLDSDDGRSAAAVYTAMGAEISKTEGLWRVRGFGGKPSPPERDIDVGNSGTSCRFGLGTAALLARGEARFDGDAQTRRRPIT